MRLNIFFKNNIVCDLKMSVLKSHMWLDFFSPSFGRRFFALLKCGYEMGRNLTARSLHRTKVATLFAYSQLLFVIKLFKFLCCCHKS